MKGFGLKKSSPSVISSGMTIHYIKENFQNKIRHINNLKFLSYNDIMELDYFTIRNLELFEPLLSNNNKSTLLYTIDKTVTSSGGRLIKNCITKPLINKN